MRFHEFAGYRYMRHRQGGSRACKMNFCIFMSRIDADVIIIGGGAAGLAAARALIESGRTVLILEGRARIGGRVYTVRDPLSPLPIELGAEFIHGESPELFGIAHSAGLTVTELSDRHLRAQNGELHPVDDFWKRIESVRRAMATIRRDRTVAEYLATHRKPAGRNRAIFSSFVEGFHAADLGRMSVRSIAEEGGESETEGANRQFRVTSGYDGIMLWLHSALPAGGESLLTGTVVRSIHWKRGEVLVEATNAAGAELGPFRARAAIVTVPIGVLMDGSSEAAIRFSPDPRGLRSSLSRLASGNVAKMIFRFREAFWSRAGFMRGRLKANEGSSLEFLHCEGCEFPTFWTAAPTRAAFITAWAGGPAADALLDLGEIRMADRGLDSLSKSLAIPRASLDDLLAGWSTHDWRADPFSRGAYSYPLPGGLDAQKRLARPVDGTLMFAGEATSVDGRGTVIGAIESGRRAAKQFLSLSES